MLKCLISLWGCLLSLRSKHHSLRGYMARTIREKHLVKVTWLLSAQSMWWTWGGFFFSWLNCAALRCLYGFGFKHRMCTDCSDFWESPHVSPMDAACNTYSRFKTTECLSHSKKRVSVLQRHMVSFRKTELLLVPHQHPSWARKCWIIIFLYKTVIEFKLKKLLFGWFHWFSDKSY